jgi:MFS family permease
MFNKIYYGWWIVIACFFINLYIGGIVFFGFTAFFDPIRQDLGWSYTQISFAASLRGLEMGILAPISGFLVYRFGSRKLMLYGTVAIGLGLIFLGLTQSLSMFYGAFLLIAFGAGGCATTVTMTAVANWFHRNLGIALGAMMSGWGASGLIVPLVIRLIDAFSWRIALIILGLGMFIVGIPLSFIIRNNPQKHDYLPDGKSSTNPLPTTGTQNSEAETGFKDALRKKSFLYLAMAEIIRLTAVSAIVTHIMPYLGTMDIPRSTAGIVAACIPVFSIPGRLFFGWLGDVFDKRYVTSGAFCFLGLGILALCYVQVPFAVLFFLLLFAPGFGGISTLRGSIVREYFGRESFSRLMGILMGSSAIGGVLGPTLAGWVFDAQGSYQIIWFIYCGLIACAIYLIFNIKKYSPLPDARL